MLDAAMWRWGWSMLRNCTEARYASTRAAWCRSGRIQPRLPQATACRHRHRLRRADAGHAAAVSYAEATRRHCQGHRDPQAITTCRTRCSIARVTASVEPALAHDADRSSLARCACRATKPATAIKFTQRIAALAQKLAHPFASIPRRTI